MNLTDFYNKQLKENPSILSIELMEKHTKHIIKINFGNVYPANFKDLTLNDLKITNEKINNLIDWSNP